MAIFTFTSYQQSLNFQRDEKRNDESGEGKDVGEKNVTY